MDRRTGADRDSSTKLPTGQTSRGYADERSVNPKTNSSRRPDVGGNVPQEGGAALQSGVGRDVHSDGYPETVAGSRFGKGQPSSIPGPENVNRGYTQVDGSNVPRLSRDTSANRHNFGIDPGEPPQPQGDDTSSPTVPKYGVGTNGE